MITAVIRSCRFSLLLLLLSLTIFVSAGKAQTGIYGMFSAGHYSGVGVGYGTPANQSGGMTARGGTFGIYDNFMPLGPVKFDPSTHESTTPVLVFQTVGDSTSDTKLKLLDWSLVNPQSGQVSKSGNGPSS